MATVVITGGNRGIGRELARLHAEAGDTVILGNRRADPVPGLAAQVLPLDVASDASVAAFARAIGDRPVDLLIANAGVIGPDRQSVTDTDFAGFLDTLNINTLGPLRVTQALLPQLRAAGTARVAILSSRMGSLSLTAADRIAYRASKAAVNKVAQGLATDLAGQGIAVVALHPGWVRTDMGGSAADLDPVDSARGLKAVIDALDLSSTGQFRNHDGSVIPW